MEVSEEEWAVDHNLVVVEVVGDEAVVEVVGAGRLGVVRKMELEATPLTVVSAAEDVVVVLPHHYSKTRRLQLVVALHPWNHHYSMSIRLQ